MNGSKRRLNKLLIIFLNNIFLFHFYILTIKLNVQSMIAMCKIYLTGCSKLLLILIRYLMLYLQA